jgi:hypothetical protein
MSTRITKRDTRANCGTVIPKGTEVAVIEDGLLMIVRSVQTNHLFYTDVSNLERVGTPVNC